MNRIPQSPPPIKPLLVPGKRPVWSVMIPVYNSSQYLVETLNSVLMQDEGNDNMQITVVDDASTDINVEELVHRIGKGRIEYFRQPVNVGSLRNFETCINLARGNLVHLLHADDKVCAGFYTKLGYLFLTYPEAGAAFCRFSYINEDGIPVYEQEKEIDTDGILGDWQLWLAVKQRIQYAAMVVRRSVYEKLGSFYGVTYGEDWEMWVRIARQYPIAYTPDMLAQYRMHFASISGQSYSTAKNLKDLQWVINKINEYLPKADRERIKKESYKFYAHYALMLADQIWHGSKNKRDIKAQVKEGLRMHKNVSIYWKVLKLYTKIALNIA